jgi:hypothetical protein
LKDNKRHGEGECTYKNKSKYKGYWYDDEKSGKGKQTTEPSGEIYEG